MPPKRKRPAAVSITASRRVAIKTEPSQTTATRRATAAGNPSSADLKERFIHMFDKPNHTSDDGVSNSSLKSVFGDDEYVQLVPIINELTQSSRLVMSKVGDELFYNLVSDEIASKFAGLDVSARLVYQVIERSSSMGIWTKDVRTQTNISQQALNKIFKALETRQLIKPVKSVSSKKVYMLYNLTPAKELTGGPWYTELEFDHEFINEMRKFLLQCVRRLNSGKGASVQEIREKMVQAKVSKVQLSLEEVQQLMQTLEYDYLIEEVVDTKKAGGEVPPLYTPARRVTSMCEFQMWDALSPDFHFRKIRFEDGVELAAHEPHHHTA